MNQDQRWAIRLPARDALVSGAMRLRGGVEACLDETGNILWLRGGDLSADLDLKLREMAMDGLFTIAADGTFVRQGSRLPMGHLPAQGWLPLEKWLTPVPQPTAPLADISTRVGLRLERCGDERPAAVLLTDLESWAAYARTMPSVRLTVLTMAASANGRLIVRGTPLPSIHGTRYVEDAGITVPCGWEIQPAVDAPVLKTLLALGEGDLALFHTDGSYEQIAANCFTRATRAGIRQTLEERRA